MPDWAQAVVSLLGYWAVPLSILIESLGIPLPAETIFLVASAFAANGFLDIRLVVLLAMIGAIAGDNGGYLIGRHQGRAFIHRHGPRVGLTVARIAFVERFFETHGGKAVFLGRFQFVLRTYTAVFAGAARMPFRQFFLYNLFGGVAWALFYGWLGFTLGSNWERLHQATRGLGIAAAVSLVLVVCGALWWRHSPPKQGA